MLPAQVRNFNPFSLFTALLQIYVHLVLRAALVDFNHLPFTPRVRFREVHLDAVARARAGDGFAARHLVRLCVDERELLPRADLRDLLAHALVVLTRVRLGRLEDVVNLREVKKIHLGIYGLKQRSQHDYQEQP